MIRKKAVVIHSGGLDSSLCLALAMREFGKENVLSLSFFYGQRHAPETEQAKKICREWGVDHTIIAIDCLKEITESALIGKKKPIIHLDDANTLVVGRNGLMARLGAIHAHHLGANCIFMGIIEVDAQTMGYRDCTRSYMDLKQQILRQDLASSTFEIRTPLVQMSKKATLELSHRLGILEFLLTETISCYEGIPLQGCMKCPTCYIRNSAIREFAKENPNFVLPF